MLVAEATEMIMKLLCTSWLADADEGRLRLGEGERKATGKSGS